MNLMLRYSFRRPSVSNFSFASLSTLGILDSEQLVWTSTALGRTHLHDSKLVLPSHWPMDGRKDVESCNGRSIESSSFDSL